MPFTTLILPVVGIALATTVVCYLITISPLIEPFKSWIYWGVLALGICWIVFGYVLPLFGVRVN